MKLLDKAKLSVSGFFDKKREEKEFQDRLDNEARETQKKIYEQEYRKAALEAAMIKARRDAVNKSGLAKLRAIKRSAGGLEKPKANFFNRLSEYTQTNIARREANIKRTEALKAAGKGMRQEQLANRKTNTKLDQFGRPRGALY